MTANAVAVKQAHDDALFFFRAAHPVPSAAHFAERLDIGAVALTSVAAAAKDARLGFARTKSKEG
jgi:hypothetical protein